ncbi:flagellar type III secretion system pore protein FliP [bacterium]|nr:flagellar type III secretion system pore protein FliP [bacterium]
MKKYIFILLSLSLPLFGAPSGGQLNIPGGIRIAVDGGSEGETVTTVKILVLLTLLTIAPAILLSMTSFARVIIVLSFTRQAIGTQSLPPNQIIIGLALFVSFFIMSPTLITINDNALQPYMDGKISREIFFKEASQPLKEFMYKQVYDADLKLFLDYSSLKEKPQNLEELPIHILIPAFITSEIKRGFQMGFMIFIPFIILDLIVASILMSMGMMMLPPAIISLPLKIMLFVLVNGWDLIIGSLIKSFN